MTVLRTPMKGEKFEDVKGVIRSKNTVTKRKGTERQTIVHKTLHRKPEIYRLSNANTTNNRNKFMCFGMVSSFCSTSGTRHAEP